VNAMTTIIVWAMLISAYWIPTIVAAGRHTRNLGSVVVVNLFAGWTFVGWVVALAMAAASATAPPSERS
jgi:Superinfection immunity protein